ncbi:MAG: LptF/LptG family permease [Ignavibacteriae bacterium]|nr:LptF/LptG family permease [Ignavibacteriota bacterium]
MKLLDKYILRHFIVNLLFGIFCFIIIFILVDLFENMDRFIDKKLSIIQLAQYYAYFIPDILKLISPIGMLLASLFTVSRFVNYSELTAMKSAGISIYRYLLPILLFGSIITGFAIYFNGWVVPKANQQKYNFERTILGRNLISDVTQNIYIQDKVNRVIIINYYNKTEQSCGNTLIQIFNSDTLQKVVKRLDIANMKWNSGKKDWKVENGFIRSFAYPDKESLNVVKDIDLGDIAGFEKINLEPEQIEKKRLKPEELELTEFKVFIDNLEANGQDAAKEKVDYYSIISFPFASIITIIFGVSISSNNRKAGAALHFGISLIVSFIYLGFVKISQVFGYNGDVNPILTAWSANIMFLAVSLFNFYRLNRN